MHPTIREMKYMIQNMVEGKEFLIIKCSNGDILYFPPDIKAVDASVPMLRKAEEIANGRRTSS